MADYIAITDSQINPKAPFTSDLAYQFRDNPLAIASGATGAPRVTGKALDLGITGFSLTSSSPTATIALDEARILSMSYYLRFTSTIASSISLSARFSNNSGSGYTNWYFIDEITDTAHRNGIVKVDNYSGEAFGLDVSNIGATNLTTLQVKLDTTGSPINILAKGIVETYGA